MDTSTTGKIQRWVLYLQQFDITVRAISGKDNGVADWLSRSTSNPRLEEGEEIDSMSTLIYLLSNEETSFLQEQSLHLSPYLPIYDQWIEASKVILKEDQKYLYQTKEGLWYSIKGKQLYVPEKLREAIIYYFHAGKFGGHHGINKTARRLYQWFFWPNLKQGLSQYISNCLACKRTGTPVIRYFRKVLERSEPFQLVSIDFVGPRSWQKEKLNYIVIIDHFSRFLLAKRVEDLTGESAVSNLKNGWIRYFGALDIVLVDRGPAFISKVFRNFVYGYLACELVYSGASYPQGNSINEATHKGLEATIIARKQYDVWTPFDEMLLDATIAYNSTPHSATGYSPFTMIFGKEMVLPGMQRFRADMSEETRNTKMKDIQMQAMRRVVIAADDNLKLYPSVRLKEGDQVVYKLLDYERREGGSEEETTLIKYNSKWSLPVKVVEVKENSVKLLNEKGKEIMVPSRLVRKIGANVPKSLQPLVTSILKRERLKIRMNPEWEEKEESRKRPRILLMN